MDMWNKYKSDLSEDILHRITNGNKSHDSNAPVLQQHVQNECLVIIEDNVIRLGGNRLQDYGLPTPKRNGNAFDQEIAREMSYNVDSQTVDDHEKKLVSEQKHAFDTIYGAVENGTGGLFFVDSPGGTGKTFLLNLLLSKVRLNIGIALAAASSGIASTLLIGGRTAHSTFKLPFNVIQLDTPMCDVTKQSSRGKLLSQACLIVLDEVTMLHRKHLEALDRTLQHLKNNSTLMGGTTVVLAGDFRQILPVITRGTKADELKACLKSSFLWEHIQKLALTTNMRAKLTGDISAETFSKQLLQIGNGTLELQEGLHKLPCGQMVSNFKDLFSSVFPEILENYTSRVWLSQRSILAPRNETVDNVNRLLLEELPGEKITFSSIDTVDNLDDAVHFPIEFLNSLQPSGMPPHKLHLKIGAPIMLLRNLDPPRLCNGTRLVARKLNKYIIEATIMGGNYDGDIVAIPRIPLIPGDLPFSFKRLQFPLRLSFAMSINKAQGQSLKVVGLHLEKPCFSHGQLYVGCSRVGSGQQLFIYSPTEGYTENIVYPEALRHDNQYRTTALQAHTHNGQDLTTPRQSIRHGPPVPHSSPKGIASIKDSSDPESAAFMSAIESDPEMIRNDHTLSGKVVTTKQIQIETCDQTIGFDNSAGNNNCWLNTVIRILAHMIEYAPTRYHDESRSAGTLIDKFLHYIKDNVIDNTEGKRYLCFDDNEISVGPNMRSLKLVVSTLINEPTFNTAEQQDAAEAIEKLLDVVPVFKFCMYRFFFQQTCTQCPHMSDPHHGLERILRVPIPQNSGIMFDMKSAIMDTLMGRDESDIQCPGCGHQTVSNKMTLSSVPDFFIVQLLLFDRNLRKLTNICHPLLDINISSVQSQHRYKLHCIIEHRGTTITRGHYVCYFFKNDQWHCANDRHIKSGIKADDLPSQPYISVYKKISTQS